MIRRGQVSKSTEAQRNYMREYYERNKENLKKRHRSYYENNKERILSREKELRDPEAKWAYNLEYKFGITVEQYKLMYEQQRGLCLICEKPPTGRFKKLAVDHCHSTGKIRGLLCSGCNRAIGYLKDDPQMLEKAAAYLRGTYASTPL